MKVLSGMIIALLLISTLGLVLSIQASKTWVVDDDGPADFRTIQDAVNAAALGDTVFVRKGLYHEYVVVNKTLSLVGEDSEETIIEGENGQPIPPSILITSENVTVRGFKIQHVGELWSAAQGVSIAATFATVECNIFINVSNPISLGGSNNVARYNVLIGGGRGLGLGGHDNVVANNVVKDSATGITFWNGVNDSIVGNIITDNSVAIGFTGTNSMNCTIVNNTISENWFAFSDEYLWGFGYGHIVYHNNFINNTFRANLLEGNMTDNGYPTGGNYWSDYTGVDLYSGPYQNETGSDGIGDTPGIIYSSEYCNAIDNYPLMNPLDLQRRDVAIANVEPAEKVVNKGNLTSIRVTVENQGLSTETVNTTLCANSTSIGSQTLDLTIGESVTITFTWNTTGFGRGNYTASATVTLVQDETDTADNSLIGGYVFLTLIGDVNADGKVDIKDVYKVAKAYGSEPDLPNWDPTCDINLDGLVDVKDYYSVCKNYGKTEP